LFVFLRCHWIWWVCSLIILLHSFAIYTLLTLPLFWSPAVCHYTTDNNSKTYLDFFVCFTLLWTLSLQFAIWYLFDLSNKPLRKLISFYVNNISNLNRQRKVICPRLHYKWVTPADIVIDKMSSVIRPHKNNRFLYLHYFHCRTNIIVSFCVLTLWTLAIFTNFANLLKFPQLVSQSETILFRKNRIYTDGKTYKFTHQKHSFWA
jgi:hypothetical protein